MKIRFSTLFVAALLAATLDAQQTPPPPYQTVICLKVQPGKTDSDYRQFVNAATLKLQQMRADAGQIVSWSLLRSVMPAGEDARCDFIQSTLTEAPPNLSLRTEDLAAALEKARVTMTASEFVARRNSLVRLISSELWRPVIRVGQPQKGNFVYVNYMREHNASEYRKFEHDIWKPMAEEWIKGGTMTGWLFGVKQLPGGTEVKYTAMSADIFPSADAALKWSGIQTMFEKIHPGQNYQETFEHLGKLRSLAERQLFVIEERAAKR
jgi:hypothetical protein